ncbi:ATP-binding protein [Streptomyces erythrochromogenes]|uniref:ATP-binding protein n=1 Tax=Streptomyces erythrochromogenes TaxID=285574 RepID=UPI0034121846
MKRALPHTHMLVSLKDVARPGLRSRRLLASHLDSLGLAAGTGTPTGRRTEEALLIASELVGNACRHANGPTRLVSQWNPRTRHLTLSVSDSSSQVPRMRAAQERGADGGYGILLIELLSERWAAVPDVEGGKTVSVTVDFPPPAPTPPRNAP